jgi:putative membrane protein
VLRRARRQPLSEVGTDPDVRFSYANERTFLAWNRTALALIAAGLAVATLLPTLDVRYGRRIIGVPLIALGAVLAWASYRRWQDNERAMRLGDPLPPSNLPVILAAGISICAVVAAVVALFGAK